MKVNAAKGITIKKIWILKFKKQNTNVKARKKTFRINTIIC